MNWQRGPDGRALVGALLGVAVVLAGCSVAVVPGGRTGASLRPAGPTDLGAPGASSGSTGSLPPGGGQGATPVPGRGTPEPSRGAPTSTLPTASSSPASPDELGPSPGAELSPGSSPFVIADWRPWPARDPGGLAEVVRRGPTRPVVALTIDDGNSPEVCRAQFEYLRANGVKATWFPTWFGVSKDRALWREIADAGYPIGNHTATHPFLTGPGVTEAMIRRQLGSAERHIQHTIRHPLLPVLRPTYGSYDDRVRRVAGEMGYHTLVLWGASAADTSGAAARAMTRAALRGGRGSIILMHCNFPVSAEILPAIVEGYRKRGFEFVTIPELLRLGGRRTEGATASVAPGRQPSPGG